jgi:hypothetical protein
MVLCRVQLIAPSLSVTRIKRIPHSSGGPHEHTHALVLVLSNCATAHYQPAYVDLQHYRRRVVLGKDASVDAEDDLSLTPQMAL